MIGGFILGLIAGWLIAGGIVLQIAFRSELADEPIGLGDVPVILGGVLLWPFMLFPDEGDDA